MKKFAMLGFVMLAGLCRSTALGQTLSFLKTLPGPNNNGSIMIVDGSGVYSFNTETVRRYDLDGTAIWSQDQPRGETVAWLASTSAGVYAAGHVSTGGPPQAFVRLYSAQGTQVWNRSVAFGGAGTVNTAIAADETGVYVAGTDYNSYYLRKFDPRGNELWTRTLNSWVRGIAVDASGIYVRADSFFRKYDRDGSEVWAKTAESDRQVYDLKANATGVYLTGLNSTNKQFFLARYDASGNEVWIRYGQSGWIALDANSVYLTAYTFREPGQCASGFHDVLVVRYDLDSKVLWTRQFGTYEIEYPQAIVTGPNGVFVTGFGSGRLFLAKLDPALAPASPSSEPRITNECVLNAASNVGGAVSPGEIVTIFGTAIGPPQSVTPPGNRTHGTELGETRVLFDGVPAPMLYASSGQLNAIVPNSVASKSSVGIQVEYRGVLSKTVNLPVLQAHPGISAVLNEDDTLNSQANPARRGSAVSIFGTGGGETNPATPAGQIIGTVAQLKATVSVDLDDGETNFAVSYAGAVPGFVAGLLQVNARLPETMSPGPVVPILTIGGSQTSFPESVRIWVK